MEFIEFKSLSYEESLNLGRNQQNRMLNSSHVKSIGEQTILYLDIMPPITVNVETNNVIDGQHRLKAFQSLVASGRINPNSTIRVQYISVPPELEIPVIIDANTHSKNWTINDYIESYISGGYVDYIRLYDWCLGHELTSRNGKPKYRYGAAIIKGFSCQRELKAGTLTINREEVENAEDVYNEMIAIMNIFKMPKNGAYIETFATIWCKYRNLCPFADWIEAFEYDNELPDNFNYKTRSFKTLFERAKSYLAI